MTAAQNLSRPWLSQFDVEFYQWEDAKAEDRNAYKWITPSHLEDQWRVQMNLKNHPRRSYWCKTLAEAVEVRDRLIEEIAK